MNLFHLFAESDLVRSLAYTLIHSLWQLTIVAILAMVLMHLLKNRSAITRYIILLTAMPCVVIIETLTFLDIFHTMHEASGFTREIIWNSENPSCIMLDSDEDVSKMCKIIMLKNLDDDAEMETMLAGDMEDMKIIRIKMDGEEIDELLINGEEIDETDYDEYTELIQGLGKGDCIIKIGADDPSAPLPPENPNEQN